MRCRAQFLPTASLPGHEDWVKCLEFQPPRADDDPLILAFGSKDATIRLWNIEPLKLDSATEGGDEILDAFEASLADMGEGEEGGRQISMKRHLVSVRTRRRQLEILCHVREPDRFRPDRVGVPGGHGGRGRGWRR